MESATQIPLSSIGKMSQQELLFILEEADKAQNRDDILTKMMEIENIFLNEPRYARDLGISFVSGQGHLTEEAEERLQVAGSVNESVS